MGSRRRSRPGAVRTHMSRRLGSGAFEMPGACRDPHGRAWASNYVSATPTTAHTHHVSDEALQGDPATLCAALADEGLKINCSKQREFAEYLSGVGVGARVTASIARAGTRLASNSSPS